MKKESIVAIVLGVVLGIGVGSVVLSQTTKSTPKAIETTTSELKENVKSNRPQAGRISFELTTPKSETTVNTNSVKIQGKGTKDSLIVAQSANANKIVKLEKDEFSIDMPLALGENTVNLTYYPKDSGSDYQEKQLVIFYLPE